jgi:8-oxo-dGTP diphosphatase
MRERIEALVRAVPAHDALEAEHQVQILDWIVSGAPLFRIQKPDVPKRHLTACVVVVDRERRRILLVDHRNAGLWLPCGGHVEQDEAPETAACRELMEELGMPASFLFEGPFFLTVTRTIGVDAGHDDVGFWYVLEGDSTRPVWFDDSEFTDVAWFDFGEIPFGRCHPHMRRVMNKLEAALAG